MDWLNYHHLLYFWVVAREGSVAAACEKLHLAQPTISGQIRSLENSLKTALFERSGRKLVLTETGRMVFGYADEIFSLGQELQEAVKNRPTGRPVQVVIGVTDSLPKLMVHRLLEPVLRMPEEVQITCFDGEPDRLMAQLALHELDLILSDVPPTPKRGFRTFNHLLGECGITVFGTPELARVYGPEFPRSLDGAPFLMPSNDAALRRSLEQWFDDLEIRPRLRGEFADNALIMAFGQFGDGLFAAPSAVTADVERMYGVVALGTNDEIPARFFAVSIEKRLKHPAVVAISHGARTSLFRSTDLP